MNHYDVLGVARSASFDVIRAAYRARMRTVHPDAGGSPELAQQVNRAYQVLSDEAARAEYDRDSAPAVSTPTTAPTASSYSSTASRTTTGWMQSHDGPPSFAGMPAPGAASPAPSRRRIAGIRLWPMGAGIAAATFAWAMHAAVLIFLEPEDTRWWATGGAVMVSLAIGVIAVRRRWVIGIVLIVLSIGNLMHEPMLTASTNGAWGIWIGLSAAIVLPLWGWASARVRRAQAERHVEEFWEAAEASGLSTWFVERVDHAGAERTTFLLANLDTGQRSTRVLWDWAPQGTFIALAPDSDEILLSIDNDTMNRGTPRRRHSHRSERRRA